MESGQFADGTETAWKERQGYESEQQQVVEVKHTWTFRAFPFAHPLACHCVMFTPISTLKTVTTPTTIKPTEGVYSIAHTKIGKQHKLVSGFFFTQYIVSLKAG